MESIPIITQIIGNLGFPIFVAVYMLIFTNKALQRLNQTLSEIKKQNALLISMLKIEPRFESKAGDD